MKGFSPLGTSGLATDASTFSTSAARIVFTSSELQEDIDRAYEAGANSYLVKPVEFEQMVHLIQRFETYWAEINRTPSTPVPVKTDRPETSPR